MHLQTVLIERIIVCVRDRERELVKGEERNVLVSVNVHFLPLALV